MKIMKNIKFSTEMPYRLVPLPEKLCIFHCSIEKLQFSRKIMKITDFNEITDFSENLKCTIF